MDIQAFGLDLGKRSFSFVGLNRDDAVVVSRSCNRDQLFAWLEQQRACGAPICVTMEACGGSHWLAEQIEALGHKTRLLPAQYVKPYATARQKNDVRDALSIAKAGRDQSIKAVPIKSADQRLVTHLHSVRRRLVGERTALVNQIRAVLWENGVVLQTGRKWLERHLSEALTHNESALHPSILALLQAMVNELEDKSFRIDAIGTEIEGLVKYDKQMKRATTIPGVGPMIASAVVAHMGDPKRFKSGRDFSAWLGLVPRQISTGGKSKLVGITKHGNTYVRSLLVHGARSVLARRKQSHDPLVKWGLSLIKRGVCAAKAIVAIANKMARIIWALLAKGNIYGQA